MYSNSDSDQTRAWYRGHVRRRLSGSHRGTRCAEAAADVPFDLDSRRHGYGHPLSPESADCAGPLRPRGDCERQRNCPHCRATTCPATRPTQLRDKDDVRARATGPACPGHQGRNQCAFLGVDDWRRASRHDPAEKLRRMIRVVSGLQRTGTAGRESFDSGRVPGHDNDGSQSGKVDQLSIGDYPTTDSWFSAPWLQRNRTRRWLVARCTKRSIN